MCRRWRQLVNSPPLLSSVALRLKFSGLPRLRSFCQWVLLRASQHVTLLDLALEQLLGDNRGQLLGADAGESMGPLAAAVTACGAARSLRLKFSSPALNLTFDCTSWIAALHSLRRLAIEVEGDLNLMVSLQPLTALQELTFVCHAVQLPPEARLPPSLTKLGFLAAYQVGSMPDQVRPPCLQCVHRMQACNGSGNHQSQNMPDPPPWPLPAARLQLTALTRLHSLCLKRPDNDWGAVYNELTALSSLRWLELVWCAHLPPCLSQLTRLEALTLEDDGSCHIHGGTAVEDIESIVQAVSQLTNLTHLALAGYPQQPDPGRLAALSHLRSLWWLARARSEDAALPAGAWLANLRRLALPVRQLHNSLPALAGARHLQCLAMTMFAQDNSDLLPEVLRWAAQRPALELVLLQVFDDAQLGRHFDAILEVQRSVPRLRIERHRDICRHPHFCATD